MGRVIVLCVLALALLVGTSSAAAPKPLPGLPSYTAGYSGWFKLNVKPIGPRRTGDAHLGTKNVYTNRRKVGRATRPARS